MGTSTEAPQNMNRTTMWSSYIVLGAIRPADLGCLHSHLWLAIAKSCSRPTTAWVERAGGFVHYYGFHLRCLLPQSLWVKDLVTTLWYYWEMGHWWERLYKVKWEKRFLSGNFILVKSWLMQKNWSEKSENGNGMHASEEFWLWSSRVNIRLY